jgi:hypothetical protein
VKPELPKPELQRIRHLSAIDHEIPPCGVRPYTKPWPRRNSTTNAEFNGKKSTFQRFGDPEMSELSANLELENSTEKKAQAV